MTSQQALQLLQQNGAILNGHFILRSGHHSRQYIQCAQALQHMHLVEQLAQALNQKTQHLQPNTILAPAMGALVIAQEIARQRKLRYIFAEKHNNTLQLRRNFTLHKNEKILIIEDVITQGGRLQQTINLVENSPATIIGIATLIDRSNQKLQPKYPLTSLIQLHIPTYPPNQLPPDLQNTPPTKPGS